VRSIGIGSAHDWASQGADAVGLMYVAFDVPVADRKIRCANRVIL
jgi:hypothetical protein